MTRDETKQILTIIGSTWKDFHPEDKTATVTAWHFFLADHDYKDILVALKTFAEIGGGKGFAPSVDQLIAMSRKAESLKAMQEGEAWSYVEQAIRKSGYYAEEEFERLKEINPLIAKAIGSASQLRAWAWDENYNGSVVSSNFMRTYRALMNSAQQEAHLPIEAKKRYEALESVALGIGEDNE